MRDGRVRRAYLGIAGGPRPLPPHGRISLGRTSAVEVTEVAAGSPAERAGIRPEDLIVELDGHAIERVEDIQRLMGADAIGRTLATAVLRGERRLELALAPAELPSES
jgi:S1-C subfamily serine protease